MFNNFYTENPFQELSRNPNKIRIKYVSYKDENMRDNHLASNKHSFMNSKNSPIE